MRRSAAIAYRLLFFLSGATGLVYQLLWVRVLYQSFGSTIQSITTVVTAYMAGLGLGAWLLGRLADRHEKPAALYGWLEVAIGVFGVVSPLVLGLAHAIYVNVASNVALPAALSIALRFGLAALVLLIPTTLMGGTLPVLTRAFMGDERARLRAALSNLYGLNTLGAALGTMLAGFFLVEAWGIHKSLWVTAATSLALGATGIALARGAPPRASEIRAPETPAHTHALDVSARRLALVLLAVTAFAALLDEIAWTRVLVMVVGGSTYAFTLVLLVFLLGIGLGSTLLTRRSGVTAAALAQGVTAAGAALLLLFFRHLPDYVFDIFAMPFASATTRMLLLGLLIGAVVLIPAIGMGMTFPLLADLLAPQRAARSADVGRAYALNTIGSITGAALTGFVLVVTLGTERTLRLGVVVSALAALALVYFAIQEGRAPRAVTAGVLAAAALLVALVTPAWSHRLLDLGPAIYARATHWGVRQIAFREGRNAIVSVWEGELGRYLKVNGKTDASDHGDMDTQLVLGLAPAAAHPGPRSAFVIGWGSGVTARALAAVPGMERLDAVEIEPAVLAMDSYFRNVNDSVLLRPHVHVAVDDARSALQLSRETYDVIVSEPSNPWIAGIATLYTPEFYRIASARLARDGVFGQWIQLYQMPLPVVAGIVANLHRVFPHVHVWLGGPTDLVVLASPQPLRYDAAWLDRLLAPGSALATLGREWLNTDRPSDLMGRFLLGERAVPRLLSRATLTHTDDRPQLEFVAAREFLERENRTTLDALIELGEADQSAEGRSTELLARALATHKGDVRGLRPIMAAWRHDRRNPEWRTSLALIERELGDTAFADSLLRGLPGAHDSTFLEADTALRRARAHEWPMAANAVRRVIEHARPPTFRHPFPFSTLAQALQPFATEGPVALADSLITEGLAWRPSWAQLHFLKAVNAQRAHQCDLARAEYDELRAFGVGPASDRLVDCVPEPRVSLRRPRSHDPRRVTASARPASPA